MTFEYVFGPVPSRRLGLSLGVDLVRHKTCSLNCVYCECGPTTRLTLERGEYVPTKGALEELDRFLSPGPQLDFVTFSGSGEPTLHQGLGQVARHVKARHPAYQVALLTNATLFSRPDVREDAAEAHVVMASLDAATPGVFSTVNRPHPALDLEEMIRGLAEFAAGYQGELWVEVFLVAGVNDTEAELCALARVLTRIPHARVVINTLDRPGSEPWVEVPEPRVLARVQELLCARTLGPPAGKVPGPGGGEGERFLAFIRRRPATVEDLARAHGMEIEKVRDILRPLVEGGSVVMEERARGVFYRALNAPAS
ncbi:MAG: radical SAM protein [Proteobacteria bacterium]|nr:radical SAM protein [Pseudomonadota bacterium]